MKDVLIPGVWCAVTYVSLWTFTKNCTIPQHPEVDSVLEGSSAVAVCV